MKLINRIIYMFVVLIFIMTIGWALTPQDDINLRNYYGIYNATSISTNNLESTNFTSLGDLNLSYNDIVELSNFYFGSMDGDLNETFKNRPFTTNSDISIDVCQAGGCDYTTITGALKELPFLLRHDVEINLYEGNYTEDIYIPPIIVSKRHPTEGGIIGLTIVGRESDDNDVKVKSILVGPSLGTYAVYLKHFQVYDIEPTSDENACVTLYSVKSVLMHDMNITCTGWFGILAYNTDLYIHTSNFVGQTNAMVQSKNGGNVVMGDAYGENATITGIAPRIASAGKGAFVTVANLDAIWTVEKFNDDGDGYMYDNDERYIYGPQGFGNRIRNISYGANSKISMDSFYKNFDILFNLSSKYNSQGIPYSNMSGNAFIINGDSTDRGEISFIRGSRTYPEFVIRENTDADTGGEFYAGPGTTTPNLMMEVTKTGVKLGQADEKYNHSIYGGIGGSLSIGRNTVQKVKYTFDTLGSYILSEARGLFIGTSDEYDLSIQTNNMNRLIIDSSGNFDFQDNNLSNINFIDTDELYISSPPSECPSGYFMTFFEGNSSTCVQGVLPDGSVAFTGNLNLAGNNITNVSTITDYTGTGINIVTSSSVTVNDVNVSMADGSTQFTGNVNFGGNEINNISKINSVYHVSDVSEFQTTINTALSNGGGLIQLAKGDYYLNDTITNLCNQKVNIEGIGYETNLIINHSGDGLVLGRLGGKTTFCGVSNLRITGTDSSDSSLKLINLKYGNFNNLILEYGYNNLEILANGVGSDAGVNEFTNFKFTDARNNCVLIHNTNGSSSSTPWNNANQFTNGYIQNCKENILIKRESLTTTGEVSHNKFSNVYIEQDNTSNTMLNISNSYRNMFSNVNFDGSSSSTQIYINNESRYNIFSNSAFDTQYNDFGQKTKFDDVKTGLQFFDNGILKLGLYSNGTIDLASNDIINVNELVIGTSVSPTDFLIYSDDTDTEPQMHIEQDGTGDSALRFRITGSTSWSMGIDNSAADTFKISDSGTVDGSTKFLIEKTTGLIKIENLAGTYAGGSAYVCVYDSGQLYSSETACP